MPETAVEQPICDICGAEVRDGSLYCYNCGGAVSKAAAADEPIPATAKNGAAPRQAPTAERTRPQRKRPVDRGTVEVVWEPRTGVSASFVIGSLVFVILAVMLFLFANYLK